MTSEAVLSVTDEKRVRDSAERFAFGKNWRHFLEYLNEERIREAQRSLRSMLGVRDLQGQSFLDIGCGSGLFSLAAVRLGAEKVLSFDFDLQSVACAQELRRRYFDSDSRWQICQGSVLDTEFLSSIGQFDIVYSWGVLHHTGHMWQALENVIPPVVAEGRLFIAIYNDQGIFSTAWKAIKRQYNRGLVQRASIISTITPCLAGACFIKDVVFLRKNPFSRYRDYQRSRGMAYWTDLLDWLGGYPFEVAKPDAIFDFFHERGFELVKLKTAGMSLGNNEFVFRRRREASLG